jgi:uncharacterized membrane protein YGL010W
MKSLYEQLRAYGAYHQSWWNKVSHFVGVPLVTFALFVLLGWFRFVHAPELPVTAATAFYLAVFLYYLRLDWRIALLQAPFTLALLWLADRAAVLPLVESLLLFATTFVGGWVIQLLGHAFEGRRPALTDNLWQILNAPLFLTVEVVTALGFHRYLSVAASRSGLGPSKQEAVGEGVRPKTPL